MALIHRRLKEAHGTDAPAPDSGAAGRFAEVAGNVPEGVPFDEIFKRAGVREPAHGFTIYRLLETESDPDLKGVAPETLAKMISGILRHLPNGPVPLEEIFHDASARDRALDAYDAFLEERTRTFVARTAAENAALQDEIDRLIEKNHALIAEKNRKAEEERARLAAWRVRKAEEEGRIARALEPFCPGLAADIEGVEEAEGPSFGADEADETDEGEGSEADEEAAPPSRPRSLDMQAASRPKPPPPPNAPRMDRPPADKIGPFSSISTGLKKKPPKPPPAP